MALAAQSSGSSRPVSDQTSLTAPKPYSVPSMNVVSAMPDGGAHRVIPPPSG